MKFTKLMLSALTIVGLIPSVAQTRPRYHHYGPRPSTSPRTGVSFGFGVNVRPLYRPVYVAPCCAGRCPFYAAPVMYAPYVRPSFDVSFGSGPVNFGFGF